MFFYEGEDEEREGRADTIVGKDSKLYFHKKMEWGQRRKNRKEEGKQQHVDTHEREEKQ